MPKHFRLLVLSLLIIVSTQSSFASRKVLDLSLSLLDSVDDLKVPNRIRQLYLDINNISSIDNLELPPKLRILGVSANRLTDISQVNFPESLRALDLSDNFIQDFSAISHLPNIRRLNIVNNSLNNENFSFDDIPRSTVILGISVNNFANIDLLSFPNLIQVGIKSMDLLDYSQVFLPETLKIISIGHVTGPDDFTGLVLPDSVEEISLLGAFLTLDELKTLTLPPNLKIMNLKFNSLTTLDGIEFPGTLRKLNLKRNSFSKAEKQKIRERFGKKVKIKF